MSNKTRNWIIGVVTAATATFVGIQSIQSANRPVWEITDAITSTPTLAYEGCAYSWATYDDVELTEKLHTQIQALNPKASANATLFGEDCTTADGTKSFGVMETDFKVTLPVDDLSKHEEFGNWIQSVMQTVMSLPDDQVQGNWGFVEFWFTKSDTEQIVFRVSIPTYQTDSANKIGAELFNFYYQP